MLADADLMGDVLAAQVPQWPPGAAQGYHGQSLGWCESQILRRVDPAGRTIGRFFAEEVAGPLGLDFHIGLPSTVSPDRIATLHMPNPFTALRHPRQIPFRLSAAVANPRSLTHRMLMNPKELRNLTDVTGQRVLGVELPSTNGTGEVRAIAKAYAVMAAGGNELDLSTETLAELERPVTPERDRLLKADIAFSVGFMKPFPMLPFGSPSAFGHTGLGGSFAFADPDTGVGFAYAPNRLGVAVPTDDREQSLRAALATVVG
jgi:CubicO group peptidase (beta-lactamase class C family)